MKNVVFVIDGFNLFFSLKDAKYFDPLHREFRWLDLKRFVNQFLDLKKEILADVFYFSAYYPWTSNHPLTSDPSKEARHRIYKNAIESTGVITSFGHFLKHPRKCPICNGKFERPEEKRTDVHIGVTLFRLATTNKYDTIILVSGDTDFIPALEAVKHSYPHIRTGVLFPYKRAGSDFNKIVDFKFRTKIKNLANCRLPATITLPNGNVISCPTKWL